MADESKKGSDQRTLTDEDISSKKGDEGYGRRGVIALLGVGAAGGALAMTGCAPRYAVVRAGYTTGGYTDGDQTAGWTDPGGNGRGPGGAYTGITDGDAYGQADGAGRGRGGAHAGVVVQQPTVVVQRPGVIIQQRTGITDRDPSDPAGNGRGTQQVIIRRSCSDSDPTDPAGGGRRCY